MEVPPWHWSATNLAKAIREKRISSQEVIRAHLDRIEAVNHKVNAVTVVLEEDALRIASEADKKIAAGEKVGPLHGVPVTFKENIDLVIGDVRAERASLMQSLHERPLICRFSWMGSCKSRSTGVSTRNRPTKGR